MSKPDRQRRDESIGIPRLDALREARRDLRFKLDVEVKIISPSKGSFSGQTLDLSDHGVSATLPFELPIGEVVELDFTWRIGRMNVFAIVRNRKEFRFGFEFVEPNPALHLIRENCCLLERTSTAI
jgi:PilZ domain